MSKRSFCIVSFCNLYYLPYAQLYINSILASESECTLLFWDRDSANGSNDVYPGCEKLVFQTKYIGQLSKIRKLIGYMRARCYFMKILSSRSFDGVIFLQSHAAVACSSILRTKYYGRYILDVRDYSLEFLKSFYYREASLVKHSFANVISSPAYRSFLPPGNYVISHNYSPMSDSTLSHIAEIDTKKEKAINISYIGTVRFYDMDKKILSRFANDSRFSINYFGRGSEVLNTYCKNNNIKNVKFHGSFTPDMLPRFFEETDIINNLYGNHNKYLDYALSNKLYHAGQYKRPILVCPDTYMEEVSLKYGIGFVFDVNNATAVDDLFLWYRGLDTDAFNRGCREFIMNVERENNEFKAILESFVKN